MKYIVITFSGLGLPIAYKLHQQGYEVHVGMVQNIKDYVLEEEISRAKEGEEDRNKRMQLFQGMLPIEPADKVIERMRSIPNPQDYFVFFDENCLYRWVDKIRDLNFHGNFPTKADFLFEVDRKRAKQFVQEHYPKLNTPEVHEFTKIKDGIKFLKESKELWVLKGQIDTARTFVPAVEDPGLANTQLAEVLANFPYKYERLGFILERFIPDIIELTPEKFYYDGEPIATSLLFENKPFGSGNISVQTGCAEDLCFPTDMNDRINKIAFPPIIDEMAKEHKGWFIWDASILIGKRDGKMYFGEFCSNRPGYSSFFNELAQCNSVNGFFESLVKKKNPYTLGTVGCSVSIFNMNRDEDTDAISSNILINYKPEIEKDVWLWDVRRNERNNIVTIGTDWNLAVITGAGKSIPQAVNRLYRNVENFAIVGSYHRPKDDYLSMDYQSSIINRINYGLERGLFHIPFDVKIGDIDATV
ncbi:MAG: hypothetical protein HZC02_01585 [Candidatus Levybacteria bacterium]|nr:hypothetical protein [Candidatus Levybacteria bacterium]